MLAGSVALLAAFILYRLQALDKWINDISEGVAERLDRVDARTSAPPEGQKARVHLLQGQYCFVQQGRAKRSAWHSARRVRAEGIFVA